MRAFCCTRDEKLIERTIKFLSTEEVKSQDLMCASCARCVDTGQAHGAGADVVDLPCCAGTSTADSARTDCRGGRSGRSSRPTFRLSLCASRATFLCASSLCCVCPRTQKGTDLAYSRDDTAAAASSSTPFLASRPRRTRRASSSSSRTRTQRTTSSRCCRASTPFAPALPGSSGMPTMSRAGSRRMVGPDRG